MEKEKLSLWERANQWLRNSITMRLITIGVLILLLLIPVSMVRDLIREREDRQRSAIQEVSEKWGHAQTINGLVLTVPYYTYDKVFEGNTDSYKMVQSTAYAHFLPDQLLIEGEVFPEERYRGIYQVIVYRGEVELWGTFARPDFGEWKIEEADILWEEAFVSLGLSDLRGLQQNVSVNWDGQEYQFNPGVETKDVIGNGISTRVPVRAGGAGAEDELSFSLHLNFNGSSNLNFIPIGKSTKVNIRSDWANPSFAGAFLPDNREIRKDGFEASWEVLHLNRPYPQQFRGAMSGITSSAFGVDLIVPVDEYQKSMRSAKYAAMFITLTFLIFFFVQILNGIRIHPIQYIMVGLALCIFYILLIALSEHLAFQLSYLISSVAIIGMVTLYSHTIARSVRVTSIIGLILVILYGFIYTILQMQDYALLMGSIGLFIVMAIVMYLSRKIDWFAINESK